MSDNKRITWLFNFFLLLFLVFESIFLYLFGLVENKTIPLDHLMQNLPPSFVGVVGALLFVCFYLLGAFVVREFWNRLFVSVKINLKEALSFILIINIMFPLFSH